MPAKEGGAPPKQSLVAGTAKAGGGSSWRKPYPSLVKSRLQDFAVRSGRSQLQFTCVCVRVSLHRKGHFTEASAESRSVRVVCQFCIHLIVVTSLDTLLKAVVTCLLVSSQC